MNVEFRKSGKTFPWDESFGNLVEFAESKGVVIDSPCRTGACGICKLRLLAGHVKMENEDGLEPGDKELGMILPCVAVPTTDIALDV